MGMGLNHFKDNSIYDMRFSIFDLTKACPISIENRKSYIENRAQRRSDASGKLPRFMSVSNSQLNEQQSAAVSYTRGPLLVVAGAGSGKTRVIIEKITHLVQQLGMPAQKIAAITFTNKAAREMKERLGKRLNGEKAAEITVSTFHSLGWKILRAHLDKLKELFGR